MNIDIERLKELNEQVEKAYTFIEQLEEWQTDISNHLALLGRFIDEAIARQSATSEEVAEAIEWVTNTRHRNQYMSGDWTAPMGNHINRTIQDTIITALQQMKGE